MCPSSVFGNSCPSRNNAEPMPVPKVQHDDGAHAATGPRGHLGKPGRIGIIDEYRRLDPSARQMRSAPSAPIQV